MIGSTQPTWVSVQRGGLTLGRARLLAAVVVATVAAASIPLLLTSKDSSLPHGLARLSWAPPRLSRPITVHVSGANRHLRLDPSRDYRIVLGHRPLSGSGGLVIEGGHNVVLIGGEIDIPRPAGAASRITASSDARRALYLSEQTGTVHVEGVLMSGADLSEGINLQEHHNAVVQIENVRIEQIRAHDERHFSDNHPDLIQTWAGPSVLRVDGLTGRTDYQALFLAPTQFGPDMQSLQLRHINVAGTVRCECILLWDLSHALPQVYDVWIRPNSLVGRRRSLWPRDGRWSAVRRGVPPGGDFVPDGIAGVDYRSPGYRR